MYIHVHLGFFEVGEDYVDDYSHHSHHSRTIRFSLLLIIMIIKSSSCALFDEGCVVIVSTQQSKDNTIYHDVAMGYDATMNPTSA